MKKSTVDSAEIIKTVEQSAIEWVLNTSHAIEIDEEAVMTIAIGRMQFILAHRQAKQLIELEASIEAG